MRINIQRNSKVFLLERELDAFHYKQICISTCLNQDLKTLYEEAIKLLADADANKTAVGG